LLTGGIWETAGVPVATSVGGLIFGLVLIGALLSVAVICAMKGKWVFFVVGWFNGIFWIIGASRLAKPNSHWAKRRYGDLEMAEAERRFSRKLLPHWGSSSFREGVGGPKPDPSDADLGRMR
jgi:hypothetical protein